MAARDLLVKEPANRYLSNKEMLNSSGSCYATPLVKFYIQNLYSCCKVGTYVGTYLYFLLEASHVPPFVPLL